MVSLFSFRKDDGHQRVLSGMEYIKQKIADSLFSSIHKAGLKIELSLIADKYHLHFMCYYTHYQMTLIC